MGRTWLVLGVGVVLSAPLFGGVGAPAAAAAPSPSSRAIVSMNVVTPRGELHDDPRPQTWEATFDGAPTTHGLSVTWAAGRFGVGVGSGSERHELHGGLSGQPGLGLHNPDTDLGGSATLDLKGYLSFDGRADFVDLATDPSGNLTRFDLVYSFTEQRAVGAVFGEIRMNEPEQLTTLSPTAQHLVWPRVGPDDAPVLATDSFRNTSGAPLPLGAATISGADRDFTLGDDTCSGAVLPAGGSCSVTVAYRPTKGGPRLASLVLPTPTDRLQVDLASSAALGRSSLTTTGKEYVDRGRKTTFSPIVVYNQGDHGKKDGFDHLYRFYPDDLSPKILASEGDEFALDLTKRHGTIKRGKHTTKLTDREYGLDYHANTQYCDDLHGTMTVRDLVLDEDGQPTYADVDFAQSCARAHTYPTGTIHGKLRYQDRKDTTAPRKPSKLRLEGGQLAWTSSSSKDLATTVVRADLGSRFQATRGVAVYDGRGQTAALPRLAPGSTYTVAAFSVDKTGNVSRPTTLVVTT